MSRDIISISAPFISCYYCHRSDMLKSFTSSSGCNYWTLCLQTLCISERPTHQASQSLLSSPSQAFSWKAFVSCSAEFCFSSGHASGGDGGRWQLRDHNPAVVPARSSVSARRYRQRHRRRFLFFKSRPPLVISLHMKLQPRESHVKMISGCVDDELNTIITANEQLAMKGINSLDFLFPSVQTLNPNSFQRENVKKMLNIQLTDV